MASPEKVDGLVRAIGEVRSDLPVIPTVFRPRPVGEIEGLRIGYVSTAPPAVLDTLSRHLEEHYGCEVVAASGNLSDRARLAEDLDAMSGVEAYLTEIKAAAVDVVTRRGAEEGKPVFYCDNDPVGDGLDARLLGLAREAVAEKAGELVVDPRRLVYNMSGQISWFRPRARSQFAPFRRRPSRGRSP